MTQALLTRTPQVHTAMCDTAWMVGGTYQRDDEGIAITYRQHRCGQVGPHPQHQCRYCRVEGPQNRGGAS